MSHPEMVDPEQPTNDASLDASKAALARARAAAKSNPKSKSTSTDRSQVSFRASKSSDSGRDPVLLGTALEGVVVDHGWSEPTAIASVTERWKEIVGPEVAEHVVIERFDSQAASLVLRTDSTAWATQMRLLVPKILARLAEEVGSGVVRSVTINGPTQPSWVRGKRTAPGRGPRDTYG